MNRSRSGVLAAIAAFFLWGVFPIFWKALDFLTPMTIVSQRTIWSLVFLLLVLASRRRLTEILRALSRPQVIGWHALSGTLLATNWLIYIWATLNGHIIEGALGYYLNPFFNMFFGAILFAERQNRTQALAIALAFMGVLIQLPGAGSFPWIAIAIAVTFSLYAVARKRATLEALNGLTVETLILAVPALTWLGLQIASQHAGQLAPIFGGSLRTSAWVVGTGVATALPLLCFGYAARTITLTSLGILQFIGPTLQFFIGWLLYDETMTRGRFISFGLIWLAIAVYAIDALHRAKRNQLAPPTNPKNAVS